ncbi:MAG: hypothetical protein N2A42_03125, partial [Luteolibacter sp.]
MKKFLSILLVPALSLSALAQKFQAEALLSKPDGEYFRAWIIAGTKTAIRYKMAKVAAGFKDAKVTDFATIYLMDPPE